MAINEHEKRLLVKYYSAYDEYTTEEQEVLEEIGMFKCTECGHKYPNGRESMIDVGKCDNH